jgi:hypothetical protein
MGSTIAHDKVIPVKPSVMIVGLGDLGSAVLELLAREQWVGRIVACSRSVERGIQRCNLARMGAMAQGRAPVIDFIPLDLNQEESVGELVLRESPDLIFNAASLQTWWLTDLLPPEPRARIQSAGFGVWLPVHLTLTLKLMRALGAVGYRGVTLTAPFPDVVNCVLDHLGLAPTSGVGNLDEIVPKVRSLAAAKLGAQLERVQVTLVAHHALEPLAFREPPGPGRGSESSTIEDIPPFFLRVELDGRDVTEAIRAPELLLAPYPLPSGPAFSYLTAGSTLRLMEAVLSESETFLHAPAPHGLPGGYPVIAGRRDVRPAPITGLTLAKAIAINERSHRFDGIERIEGDGTVVFLERAVELLRSTLRYDCKRLRPQDAEARAMELMARLHEYAERLGVKLPQRS